MKLFVKKHFTSFSYFYAHLRHRIILTLFLSILVGLMDGLGLAMFLPMLEMVADQKVAATSAKMGNLAFILEFIGQLGFSLTLTVVLLTILLFFTLKGIFKWIELYLNVVYQQYFIRKIRVENINLLSTYRYDIFVSADAGRIQNTMSGEVGRVVSAYRMYMQMIQQAVMVLTYAFLAFLSNPQFAVLVAVAGLLTNVIFYRLYKKTKELSNRLTNSSHDFQGLLIQQVAFFKYLKASGLIRRYSEKLIREICDIEDAQKRMGILSSIMAGLREPLLIAVIVAVILIQVNWLGGSLGLIVLSILFFYRALSAVSVLQTAYNQYLGLSGSLNNLVKFTEELSMGHEKPGGEKFLAFSHDIQLSHLNFSYQNTPILRDINLRISRNETIAIVGESGSGKTTLVNILSGLLQPSKGRFLIDGRESLELDMGTFQKRIGYITQEPVIFDGTIFNNVTFWDEKTPENLKRFHDALAKANILDFVLEQLDTENTRLGNNGINLSGGQKQRISIARELYKDVDFLFMDEATSALDSETERVIQENIDALKGQYTIIIIAHRLSTIKNADRVVLLRNGCIEQIGSYGGLIQQSASFKRMVELQEL